MRTVGVLAIALMGSFARAADTSLEFSGYFSHGADRRFVVSDLATRRTSDWLAEGQSFQGHTIVGFEPAEEVLVLKNAEGVVRLRLKSSKVLGAKSVPDDGNLNIVLGKDGSISLGGETLDLPTLEAKLRKLAVSQRDAVVVMRIARDAEFKMIQPAVESIPPLVKQIGLKFAVKTDPAPAAPPRPRQP